MKSRWSVPAVALSAAVALLAGCTGPVEFSAGGPDTVSPANPDSLDFGPMDRSIAQCKAASQQAGTGQCAKVRAYEACMKGRGYFTLMGPENPSGCGEPSWQQDVRKLLR
ncbi:hypothetical protein ACU4GI_04535 [Cupriavidus basilensis]|uniref:hypothetical protein n=1 Tax=Cupriavidus sp. TaxID=1873897 RepID=UPI00044A700C